LLIQAFELGIAETAEHLGADAAHKVAYEVVADVNSYIKEVYGNIPSLRFYCDLNALEKKKGELRKVSNFTVSVYTKKYSQCWIKNYKSR